MTDLTTLKTRRAEADTARHALALGESVVSVTDLQGQTVTYVAAEMNTLRRYIAELDDMIAAAEGTQRRGPIRFVL